MTTTFTGTLFDMGSTPVLEEAMRYAEDRHRRILSNVANAETPGYRRQDIDPHRFSRALDEAIKDRDRNHPGVFTMKEDVRDPVHTGRGFRPWVKLPYPGVGGPLRHDENNVSMEREMAVMAKNAGAYSTYSTLLAKGLRQIRSAISERAGT